MSGRVSADWMTLMGQADSTASGYFFRALQSIQASKSDEYEPSRRKATPEEITQAIALARVMAMDFHSSSLSVAADKISDGLEAVANAIESLAESRSDSDGDVRLPWEEEVNETKT